MIVLPDHVIKFADELGHDRFTNARHAGREKSNNGFNKLEDDINGARAEAAGYLWLRPIIEPIIGADRFKGFWKLSRTYEGKVADLAGFIDAKAIVEQRNRLMVQKTQPPDWAYLLVDGSEHPRHVICGWLWGHEAQKIPLTDPTGKGRWAHFVSKERLRTPESLIPEVLKRYS